ncbi:MAG: SRPBCC family protein [Alphaproteobacteria bacterium]
MSNPEFVYTTYVKTTPEKLWEAITNPQFARQYWGGNANFSDWKKGSKWQHEDTNNGNAVRVAGEVLESTPPKRLVLSWVDPQDATDTSRVSFDIDLVGGLTRLVVIHNSFKAGSDMAGKVSMGWPLVLSSLKSFLETGEAIDIFAVKAPCSGTKAA